jgi:protein TonB
MALAILFIGRNSDVISKPLPEATVVRLVRPKPIPAAIPKAISKEFKQPETAPPMKLPPKTKPKSEPKKKVVQEKPKEKPKRRSVSETPRELKGEAGTLKLKNPGFEYDFYLALIQSKIERNFRPPPGVRGQHLATMSFTITRSGSLTNITLVKPAGNSLINRAAVRAIRAAGRFPPLPSQYEKGELGIYFEFVVNDAAGG